MECLVINHLIAIDDERAFLDIIERVAQSAGFTATTTTDPARFKEAVEAESPDVVLLDLQMPDCDGVEFLRFLADKACRAKIFLVSGFDPRVINLARDMGDDFRLDMGEPLQKPVRPVELRQMLARLRSKSFEPDASALRQALAEDRIELYYQPLVELRDGRTIGFEALARWNHPEFGMIMPDRFIKLAEREGLIDPFTERVVGLAVHQLADWRKEGFLPFVSVNVSAANIVDARLPDRLAQLCGRCEVPPDRFCLELTETAAMGDPTLMLEVLTRLRLKGFKLAIDDFGTGYSSMLQLHRLPFSELKIDQSFVAEMERSEEARIIVGAIAGLGKNLGLELVAEGVENQALLKHLVGFGCEIGQGYHFSRPMPAGQVLDWLANNGAAPTFSGAAAA
jgi:EAL domain-containing protein (putative c-di-GMP-specific phosphodiesterase class I)